MFATPNAIPRHRVSVDWYHRAIDAGLFTKADRIELIEGELIDMPPIRSDRHSIVLYLTKCFERGWGDRSLVSTQGPITLGPRSEPEPDLAVLKPREDYFAGANPRPDDVLLLVEVASSSLNYDTQVKVPLYARHTIPEVWVISLPEQVIHCYRDAAVGGPYNYHETVPFGQCTLRPIRLPEISLDLTFVVR